MAGIAGSGDRRSRAPRIVRGLTLAELLAATAIAVVVGSTLFPLLGLARSDDQAAAAVNYGRVARGIAL